MICRRHAHVRISPPLLSVLVHSCAPVPPPHPTPQTQPPSQPDYARLSSSSSSSHIYSSSSSHPFSVSASPHPPSSSLHQGHGHMGQLGPGPVQHGPARHSLALTNAGRDKKRPPQTKGKKYKQADQEGRSDHSLVVLGGERSPTGGGATWAQTGGSLMQK